MENLDAWSAYHLGLQHLYRFNRGDNGAATALFQRAAVLDPTFARAHAALSFVHFQSGFMHYTDDIASAVSQARRFAERGLELDPLDPFVNFTMGRTYWLQGDLETGLGWLERATAISPHYAQGIYARAWTEVLSGRAGDARQHVDLAMRLSPLDPLHYAMLTTRAFTHMASAEDAEAAHWAERGARSPGAHVLVAMVAVGRAYARGRQRASGLLDGERPRAKCCPHAPGFLQSVSDEVGADARTRRSSARDRRLSLGCPRTTAPRDVVKRSLTDSLPLPDDFRVGAP